jgi:pimeloyl-ACP methyl ester carboxylesterase
VVLLHGSGATSAMWPGDVASYVESHRVYAVDNPGQPGMSAPTRSPLASGAYADWLGDVLDALGFTTIGILDWHVLKSPAQAGQDFRPYPVLSHYATRLLKD